MAFWAPLAAAAGGALSYLTGKKASKERDTTPNIEQYAMPQQTEAGGTALDILKQRATGQGVAFSPEQLTMYGQPYAQAMNRQWETKIKPQMDESWAARGLSRSTMAGQAEQEGLENISNLIGLNWADLQKWNETLKQQGIQGGVSGLMSYMQSELAQRGANTGQKWEDYYRQLQQADLQKQRQSQLVPNALTTAGNIMGGLGY